MKFDGFPGETLLYAFKLKNGNGWITTYHLIIEKEKHNSHFKIIEKQLPEMYLLHDFERAEIKDETLTAQFKNGQEPKIRLPIYSPSLLKEVKDYMEEAAKHCK